MKPPLARLAPYLFFALATTAPRAARADEVDACIREDADVQRLRGRGLLVEALAAARACSNDACPRPVRDECVRWSAEIDATLPTVRLLAVDPGGHPPGRVSAAIDGLPRPDFASGKPLSMNPGRHVVRLEAERLRPVEEVLEVGAADRDRVVSIRFDAEAVSPAVWRPVPPAPGTERYEPAVSYVFGAVAAGGVLAFAGLGTAGAVDYENLKRTCAPGCDASRVGTDHTLLVGADVGLVVALVAAGATVLSHFAAGF